MTEKTPSGTDLLATLIELLADQEGVKIEYQITCKEGARAWKVNT